MAIAILPRMIAVLYLRMSSDKQDASIPAQRAALIAYAKKKGYTILREYVDEGISGDSDDREAFLRLRQDAVTLRDFAVVLCWDMEIGQHRHDFSTWFLVQTSRGRGDRCRDPGRRSSTRTQCKAGSSSRCSRRCGTNSSGPIAKHIETSTEQRRPAESEEWLRQDTRPMATRSSSINTGSDHPEDLCPSTSKPTPPSGLWRSF